jgi:rare lipoprotein A
MNLKKILILLSTFLFASCSSLPRFTNNKFPESKRDNKTEVNNTAEEEYIEKYKDAKPLDSFTGIASYYGNKYNGEATANGEIYNMNAMTAAANDVPFNSIVRVTNIENSKSVIVRINDRGPLLKRRLIDVSLEAAKKLSMTGKGTVKVLVEVLKYGKPDNKN